MKINIISAKNIPVAMIDGEVLNLLFKKIKDKTQLDFINGVQYKCPNASINIFLQ